MIADMAAGVESARLLTYKTAFLFDEGESEGPDPCVHGQVIGL